MNLDQIQRYLEFETEGYVRSFSKKRKISSKIWKLKLLNLYFSTSKKSQRIDWFNMNGVQKDEN